MYGRTWQDVHRACLALSSFRKLQHVSFTAGTSIRNVMFIAIDKPILREFVGTIFKHFRKSCAEWKNSSGNYSCLFQTCCLRIFSILLHSQIVWYSPYSPPWFTTFLYTTQNHAMVSKGYVEEKYSMIVAKGGL